MEDISEFIGLIVVFCVSVTLLDIILFVKVWGMANDTSRIKGILQEWLNIEHPVVEDEKSE